MTTPHTAFIGLDLGQANTYSALAVLTRERREARHAADAEPVYALPYLHRFPLGTPYPAIVAFTASLLQTPELAHAALLVDRTIVGRAVSDLFASVFPEPDTGACYPITITSGDAVATNDDGGYRVPKRELVSVLQVLLQARRLQIAPSLPHADVLVQELRTFQVKPVVASNDAFEAWREGPHDDLLLATALAAWYAERHRPHEKIDDAPHVGTVAAWATTTNIDAFRHRFPPLTQGENHDS